MNKHIVTLIVMVTLLGLLGGQTTSPSTASAFALEHAAAVSATQITHGAHLRPVANFYGQEILDFNTLAGKDIGVLMYFVPWDAFDPYLPNLIQQQVPADRRPAIMLTWEPGPSSQGCNLGYKDGTGPLRSILSGRCDSYIRSFAQSLNARPERFLLRLAHEMNTADYWWGHAYFNHGSNAPAYYTAMFQRVHGIFRAEGVDNVEWVWSPNYASNPPPELSGYEWNTIHAYYPGNTYVDWISLSGYNWYGYNNSTTWMTFSALYDSVLQDLACHYAKPQILAEISTVDGPGSPQSKVDWITDAYQRVPNYPFVRSIVWFNDYAFANPDGADFRVTTGRRDYDSVVALPVGSGAWTQAYRNGLADSNYNSTLASLSDATPPQTYCGEAPSVSVTPSTGMAVPGDTVYYQARSFGYTESLALNVDVPAGVGITASITPSVLSPFWDSAVIAVQTSPTTPLGPHNLTIYVGGTPYPVTLKVYASLYRVYLPVIQKE